MKSKQAAWNIINTKLVNHQKDVSLTFQGTLKQGIEKQSVFVWVQTRCGFKIKQSLKFEKNLIPGITTVNQNNTQEIAMKNLAPILESKIHCIFVYFPKEGRDSILRHENDSNSNL